MDAAGTGDCRIASDMTSAESAQAPMTPTSRPVLHRRSTTLRNAAASSDSQDTNLPAIRNYQSVMLGNLADLPPVNSRVVRIFLSSTFSDMSAERNCLMQHANPRLKKFCRDAFGLEFQTIDMRWGVGDDVQLDHRGPDMCYQEIENALASSAGPYFICLLGQRYGNQPPVALVEEEVFEKIVSVLTEEGCDVSCLLEWYIEDNNNVPPVRVLKPIATPADSVDKNFLYEAYNHWVSVRDSLVDLMKRGAELCSQKGQISQVDLKKFFSSVTEMEVMKGILLMPEQKLAQALAFVREFSDLDDQPDFTSGKLFKFIDLKDAVGEDGRPTKTLNETAYKMVKELNQLVIRRMPAQNAFKYSLKWSDDNKDVARKSQKIYLESFANDYCSNVQRLVNESVRESMRLRADDLYTEVLQHSTACVEYAKKFQGRKDIIVKVKAYVEASNTTEPLVVHGDSGSGKTSLLGKAASLVRGWLPESDAPEAIVLLRFLGTSPGTSSIRQTLKYLCRQLALFGNDDDKEKCESLDDFKEILNTFYSMLDRIGQFRRILVFLDSVDQLDSSDGAYHLTWVRTPLPANVKMIVSTLPNMFDLLKTFKGKLPNPDIYVEVTPLEPSLCMSILSALLSEQGRTLSRQQWALIEQAFSKCSLPIYVHLLYHEVLRWRSYQPVDESCLRYTIRQAIFQLFEKLELKHGKMFTSHALAFITASRNGLSESELEDLLSLDDTVLIDVFQHHLPPFIRIPPICWARLRHDIGSYLVEREADNIRVVFWYHRQFIEVAQEYFLSDEKTNRDIHSIMADYFLGLWSGRKKKFVYPGYLRKKLNLPEYSMEDRAVPEQPFVLRKDEDGTVQYNLRKLNELPWHLIKSERLNEFYDYIVFDYDFMFNKLKGTSRYLLLRDLDLPQKLGVECISEAELVYNAIRLSAQSLVYDPGNLSVDLIGRLIVYEKNCPRVKLLLNQCRQSKKALSNCCLIPRVQCFDSGSGVLYSSFDLGLGMGIMMPNGQIVTFSLVDNEITHYDIEGNEIKRYSSDYNFAVSLKFLTEDNVPEDGLVTVIARRDKNMEAMRDDDEPEQQRHAGIEDPHDIVRLDLNNGKATRLMSLARPHNLSINNVRVVRDKYILLGNQAKKTLLLSIKDRKLCPLHEDQLNVSSALGGQYLDSEQDCICVGISVSDQKSTLLYLKNLGTGEAISGDLLEIFQSVDRARLEEMVSLHAPNDNSFESAQHARARTADLLQSASCILMPSCCIIQDSSILAFLAVLKDAVVEDTLFATFSTKNSLQPTSILHLGLNFRTVGVQCVRSASMKYVAFFFKTDPALSEGQPLHSAIYRGFIYHVEARCAYALSLTTEQVKFTNSLSKFGESVRARFTENEQLLVTNGNETLMLVWSVRTGQLLHGIKTGSAESILCGQPKGTDFMTICYLPDRSADKTDSLTISIKVYNLRVFSQEKQHVEEASMSLPLFALSVGFCCAKFPGEPQKIELLHSGGSLHWSLDASCSEVSQMAVAKPADNVRVLVDQPRVELVRKSDGRGTARLVLPNCQLEPVLALLNSDLSESGESDNVVKCFGFTLETTEEQDGTAETRKAISAPMVEYSDFLFPAEPFLECISVEPLIFIDQTLKILIQLKFPPDALIHRFIVSVISLKTMRGKREGFLFVDEIEENPFSDGFISMFGKTIFKEQKPGQDLTAQEKLQAIGKFLLAHRPSIKNNIIALNFSPKCRALNLALAFKGEPGKKIRIGVRDPPIWLGSVIRISYGGSASMPSFRRQDGKLFDMGLAVAFLDDNQHLVNYKLQVVDYMRGEVVRCIRPDEELYFIRMQATSDCSLVVGQRFFPSYKVDIAAFDDPSANREDTFAIVPPRCLQVYRISDGTRLANYLFETNPVGFCLFGERDRDLLVLMQNSPLQLFRLAELPEEQADTTMATATTADSTAAMTVSGTGQNKEDSYQTKLDCLRMALGQAFVELAVARPADPIAFLAGALLRQRPQQHAEAPTKETD